MDIVFWIGIIMAFAGIAALIVMAMRARKVETLPESERQSYAQKLIALNFLGLLIGILGLILIVISKLQLS